MWPRAWKHLFDGGGICISRRVYDDVCSKIDVIFKDDGFHHLKNISRPVHIYRTRLNNATAGLATRSQSTALSIAVLAFANMSDDEQEHLADGTVEEIITASRLTSFRVIARSSSLLYRRVRST
jgi:adenylate cyclase